jgi:RNA polymerase sigma factor (TIGR02999 family)
MQSERPDHTLRATALVHEACIKLLTDKTRFEDRKHFLAIVAITMRRVLVEHARSHLRVKRGSGAQRLTLGDVALASKPVSIDVLDMDVALTRLSEQDPRKARLIELTYFGGLSGEESAEVLEVSTATVNRDLKLARAWLHHELTRQNQDHGRAGMG